MTNSTERARADDRHGHANPPRRGPIRRNAASRPEPTLEPDEGFQCGRSLLSTRGPRPADVMALQRSAGNRAVTEALLQRAPDTITAKQQDELLTLALRSAAFRAREEHDILKAARSGGKRFATASTHMTTHLDEALLVSSKTAGGREAFQAANTLFGSAIPLVRLALSRGWAGAEALQTKLSALNLSLQNHGYRFPLAQIEGGRVEQPRKLETRDLLRAAQLALTAARAELLVGLKKLHAERKVRHEPIELFGSRESAVHLKEAAQQILDAGQLKPEDRRTLVTDVIRTGEIGVGLLKEGAILDGGTELWDQINALNVSVGLRPVMLFGTATARSRQEAAAEKLEALNKKRLAEQESGKVWTPDESKPQIGAEHEAVEAANEALGRARNTGGDSLDVSNVMQRVNADIDRIELARSIGYTDAVTFLASQALDTPSNVKAFAQSLIGNVIWAMSSFIPAVGLLKEGSRFVIRINDVKKLDALLGATVGLIGAMVAQFSAGMPSSGAGDVSGQVDQLKKVLKDTNSHICDHRRAQSYIALSRLMSEDPPKADEDRASYLVSLETALRHLLYGEVFEKKLNDGPRPNVSKVEEEAKRQLLVAATAPFAGVIKGKLEATTPALDLDYAKKILKRASQSTSLKFDPFDLVGSRIAKAAEDMGCQEALVDPREVNAALARGESVHAVVHGWSWRSSGIGRPTGMTGSFTRWHQLHRDGRVRTDPDFTLARELDGSSLRRIYAITVTPADMSRQTFHGKEIFSLDRVSFSAEGGANFSGMFRGSKPPDTFKIIYNFTKA